MSSEPMTIAEFEAFYKVEWPILVKFLRVIQATGAEAEDAAQKAMTDLARRLISAGDPVESPRAWVRRAAYRYFVKERQYERDRMTREIRGGHLAPETYDDDGLVAVEDETFVEDLLQSLTLAQREVPTPPGTRPSPRPCTARAGGRRTASRQGRR
jgi:DNA-directed RNA polymerase specialized sigma24 family protein